MPRVVLRLLEALYPRIAAGELSCLGAAFIRRPSLRSVTRRPSSRLDIEAVEHAGYPPLRNLTSRSLIERLTEDYLYARLLEAAAESFSSINTARPEIMRSATEHIDVRTADLRRQGNRLRQEQITEEVIELQASSRSSPPRWSANSACERAAAVLTARPAAALLALSNGTPRARFRRQR